MSILNEEDFEEAEAAVQTISCWYNCVLYFSTEVCIAEKTLYEFAKKVLAEARRDFLTEVKTAESVKCIDMGVLEIVRFHVSKTKSALINRTKYTNTPHGQLAMAHTDMALEAIERLVKGATK